MSRKHNTKHRRSPSNYKSRLEDRGLRNTPRMADFKLSDNKQGSAKR